MDRSSRADSGARLDPSTTLFEGGATAAGIFRCPRDHPPYRPAARPHDRSEDRDRVQAVLALVAARFRDPLRLEDLARFAGISIVHLCRLFRRHTGSSIHQTLSELRLRAALEAIGDPRADLTRVALDLGFSSHSHFSETFRRTFGCPPSQLRRRL